MKTDLPREIKNGYLVLPTKFSEKGFTYTQIKRKGNKAIYEQNLRGSKSFEVIFINRHEKYEIAGNEIPASETYPSSSSWGTYGWTYMSLDEAIKKYNNL